MGAIASRRSRRLFDANFLLEIRANHVDTFDSYYYQRVWHKNTHFFIVAMALETPVLFFEGEGFRWGLLRGKAIALVDEEEEIRKPDESCVFSLFSDCQRMARRLTRATVIGTQEQVRVDGYMECEKGDRVYVTDICSKDGQFEENEIGWCDVVKRTESGIEKGIYPLVLLQFDENF